MLSPMSRVLVLVSISDMASEGSNPSEELADWLGGSGGVAREDLEGTF